MRWLICFTVVFIGCVSTLPSDNTVSADIAAETARLVVQLRNEIKPTPTPDSGDCENCIDGYVGDGTIKVKCQVCGGTGKK